MTIVMMKVDNDNDHEGNVLYVSDNDDESHNDENCWKNFFLLYQHHLCCILSFQNIL
jgi:hypothetical protein